MKIKKTIKPNVYIFFAAYFLFFLCLKTTPLSAQGWTQNMKQLASSGGAQDQYGNSVALAGDFLVIGAVADDDNGMDAGAVYLYGRNQGGPENWGLVKKILASDGAASDQFGNSVFLDGDYLIVGANGDASSAGAAYLFQKDNGGSNNWGQLKKLTASDAATSDEFGISVSIAGDYVLVGASGNDDAGSASGAAYLFKKDTGGANNWGQLKKLTATGAASDDTFGNSVSISGDYALVGASGHVNNLGTAFLFKKDTGGTDNWGQLVQLYAGDAFPNENFGNSVSISGEYLAIGAKNDNFTVGASYIYSQNEGGTDNWGQVQKLIPTGAVANDLVGESVSLRGTDLIVGAQGDSSGRGAAYIYSKDFGGSNNWGQLNKIAATDGLASDAFGIGVAIDGLDIIVGAFQDDDAAMGADAGSAYLFKRRCSPSLASLNTTTGDLGSAYTEVDAMGWTHYCSCNGELLLSVEKGTSGVDIRDDGVSLKVEDPIATFYSSGCGTGCFIDNPDGAVVFNRKWEVSPLIQPSSDLSVRFYFTAADFNAVNSELFDNGLEVLMNPSQLSFYKVTNVALGVHPDVVDVTDADVVVLKNGGTATTARWVLGNHGSDFFAEFQVSSFSGGGGGAGGAGESLPVELLAFDATLKGRMVNLNWQTASEQNNLGFTIERSVDLNSWTILDFVEGAGTTNELQRYGMTDLRPVAGDNYYRLKQEDLDGTSTYSSVVHVFLEMEGRVSAFVPNPVEQGLWSQLQFFVEVESRAELSLFDHTGVLVHRENLQLARGGTNIPINTEELTAGIYFLNVKINERMHRKKLIVSRG